MVNKYLSRLKYQRHLTPSASLFPCSVGVLTALIQMAQTMMMTAMSNLPLVFCVHEAVMKQSNLYFDSWDGGLAGMSSSRELYLSIERKVRPHHDNRPTARSTMEHGT